MASIYEKPPLFKLQKTWNEKTILPEVYKLTSPNPRNKNKAKIHKDSGLYGIEYTVDKMIPDFNKGADIVELDYATAFVEFKNVLEGALNLAWKDVLKEHFPEPMDDPTGVLLPESNNRNSKESFQKAIELFLQVAFVEFKNVLEGTLNSAWKYALKEHFPEPMDDPTGVLSPESNNRNSKESFQQAIELFLQRSMHEKKLRDHQLIDYQPGGDFQV